MTSKALENASSRLLGVCGSCRKHRQICCVFRVWRARGQQALSNLRQVWGCHGYPEKQARIHACRAESTHRNTPTVTQHMLSTGDL